MEKGNSRVTFLHYHELYLAGQHFISKLLIGHLQREKKQWERSVVIEYAFVGRKEIRAPLKTPA